MTTTTLNAELPQAHRADSGSARLVRAELLKVRKRRGLVATTAALTVLPMIVVYVILVILHAADPAKHGPAGGAKNFADSLNFLGALTLVAGILVGATVGTGDLGSGVFRELVVTGRSRLALFAARVPAGLAFLLAPVAIGFTVSATAATLLAGSLDPPGAGLIVHSAAWLALLASLSFVIALGISSVVSSRGTSIGVLLGWLLVAMPLLMQISSLGVLREGLIGAATDRLEPAAVLGNGGTQVPMSLAAAVVVVAAWAIVPLAAGAWRTKTRDA
jgi:ABC-2 family transporter protein